MGKKSVQNHKCVSMGESRGKTLVKRVISMVLILAMVFVSDAFYGLEIAKAEDAAVISIQFNELRGASVEDDKENQCKVLKVDSEAEQVENIDFLNGNQSVSSNATNNVIYMDVLELLTLDVSCASGNWGAAITDVAGNALGSREKLQVRNNVDSHLIWEETNEIGIGAANGKLRIISGKKVQGPSSGLYLYVYNYGEGDTVTATFKAKIQFYNPALSAKVTGDEFIVGKKSKTYGARVLQTGLDAVKEGDYTTSLSTTDKFRWSVSDTTKATIGEATGVLTAKDVENGSVDVIGQAWNGIEVSDSSQALMVTKKRNCRIQTDKPVAISKSVSAEKLSFKETSYEFAIGNEFVLYSNIVATPQNYTDDLVWTSSNTDVAVVRDGIVTAKKTGTTTITVQGDNQQVQATCTVRVYSTAQKLITYLEENNTQSTYKALRDQNTVTVRVEEIGKDGNGATEAIEASVTEPEYIQVTNVDTEENASKKYYEIKVLKPVTTKKECTVVFQAKDSGVSASFRVEIFPSVPDTAQIKLERENATVDGDTVDVYIGDQNPVVLSPVLQDIQPNDQFDWKVTENAPLLKVTTKSSSVSLVGLARGTAKLVATARSNTKVSKTINIRVLQGASKVTLTNQTLSLAKGSRASLGYSFVPEDTDEALIWNSSDTTVATVDQSGKLLGVGEGTATITATTEHTGLVASCVVTVTESSNMTLSNTTITAAYGGKSQNITVTVKDAASGAVVSNPEVTWESENTDVVTVEKTTAGAATLTFGQVGQTYVNVTYGESDSSSVLVTVTSRISDANFEGLGGDSSNRTQFTYLPNGKKPEFSVKVTTDRDARANGLYTLEQGKDYTVADSCTDSAQKGNYTYTVNGDQVCYTGSKPLYYQVVAKDISNGLTDSEIGCSIENQTYTGSQLKPDVFLSYTVGNETQTLVDGTDYSVTYTNNVNAGTATATITGKGNFTGSFQKEFTIYPYDLNGVTATITKNPVYTGAEVIPTFSVKYNTKNVAVGTDFEVTYTDNINAGSNAKLVLTAVANGNYTGTKSITFTIEPKSITRVTAAIEQQTYCGSALSPEVAVKDGEKILVAGVDYAVVYADNVNAGTAKATLTGMGNYNETKEITFRIAKADMKSVSIAPIPTQYYVGGSPVKPKLNVTIGETALVEGVDYEATYENNISVGTATITIKATASSLNLSGSTSATFTIVQRENINYPADSMVVNPVSESTLIGDTIYVDTGVSSYYEINISSALGACDDVSFASVPAGETLISGGTSLIDDGTKVLLEVKGLKPGNTTLYLETLGGRIRKTLNVTVYRPAESFHINAVDSTGAKTQISGGAASIVANHTLQLEAVFTPSDSTDFVTWTVNRPDIATVNEDGVLTALNPGTITITGTIKATENNARGKTVSGIVTVIENKPATSITLDKATLSLKEGASATLKASSLPENNTEQLVWKSSDEKVATVSQVGKVTAVSRGVATITCSNFEGNISASCVVTVSAPATSIALSEAEKTLNQGDSFELVASLVPETAFEDITWTLSQEGIVTIEKGTPAATNQSNIKVTAVAAGSVTITATSALSNKTAKCTVAVVGAEEIQVLKPGKAVIKSAKNTGKKKMQIIWNTVDGAEGYQIAYGLKSNFKGAKKKNVNKSSVIIKSLKKKKTYYVRVRAYKTVNGQKLYGAWSGKKKVKIKK